jgi:hypothetical protein
MSRLWRRVGAGIDFIFSVSSQSIPKKLRPLPISERTTLTDGTVTIVRKQHHLIRKRTGRRSKRLAGARRYETAADPPAVMTAAVDRSARQAQNGIFGEINPIVELTLGVSGPRVIVDEQSEPARACGSAARLG